MRRVACITAAAAACALAAPATGIAADGGSSAAAPEPSYERSPENLAGTVPSGPLSADGPVALAAPCGLSYRGPIGGRYDYTIRNCHSYPVKRKLDIRRAIIGYPDGPCKTIGGGRSISDWISIPDNASIAGMKEC